jgi:hypothetical protein
VDSSGLDALGPSVVDEIDLIVEFCLAFFVFTVRLTILPFFAGGPNLLAQQYASTQGAAKLMGRSALPSYPI